MNVLQVTLMAMLVHGTVAQAGKDMAAMMLLLDGGAGEEDAVMAGRERETTTNAAAAAVAACVWSDATPAPPVARHVHLPLVLATMMTSGRENSHFHFLPSLLEAGKGTRRLLLMQQKLCNVSLSLP